MSHARESVRDLLFVSAQRVPIMKILLYGNSLALTGLAVSLQAVEGVEVTQSLDPMVLTDPKGLEDPAGLPDIVVVDTPLGSSPLTRRCVHRNLPLVSVDVGSGMLTALWGKSFPVTSMQEVARCLADLCRATEI